MIRLRDTSTWPRDLLLLLNQTDGSDVETSEAFRELLARRTLIGYHCTRLLEFEIQAIHRFGLEPLNEMTLERRIRALEEGHIITPRIAHQMRIRSDDRTTGTLRFLFHPPVDHKPGIFTALRHWGGAELSANYGKTTKVAHVLRSLGVPVIIEAAVPVSKLSRPDLLHRAMIRQFFKHPEPAAHEEMIHCHIEASRITRIIRAGQRAFYPLTGMRTRNYSHVKELPRNSREGSYFGDRAERTRAPSGEPITT